MNIRLVIAISMILLVFPSISYFYIGDYLRKKFTVEKNFPPEIYQLKIDAFNDIQPNISMTSSHISNTHYNIRIPPSSSTNDWIKKMEEKYRQTNERIRKICDEYKTKSSFDFNNNDKMKKQNILHNMVVDVKHHLAYCPIAKVNIYF